MKPRILILMHCMELGEVYRALTHGDGFYRDIFKNFKGNFDRILMMGVSPMKS